MLKPKDPQIRLTRGEGRLKISWPWERFVAWLLLPLGLFLPFVGFLAVFAPGPGTETRPWLGGGLVLVFVCVLGAVPLVGGLAHLLNRIELTAEKGRLTIRSRPLGFR